MPKSPEITRNTDGHFEPAVAHKPNAALEAFDELVRAGECQVKADHGNIGAVLCRFFRVDKTCVACQRTTWLRQSLTRAGEIRKALAHQDAAFLKAADNLRDCYADCCGVGIPPTTPSIRQYDEARAKIGREGK